MANKHTRDFGLNHGQAGKGDAPRTNQGAPEWQENFAAIENFGNISKSQGYRENALKADGFVQNSAGRWTKKY